jgi:acyl carrier protein
MKAKIKKIICTTCNLEEKDINENTHFINDLCFDFLDITEIHIAIEDQLNVDIPVEKDLYTIKTLAQFLDNN